MIPTKKRVHSWRYEVWDRTGYTGRSLKGVQGGNLGWQKNQAIKGQGSLNVIQNDNGPLLSVFIKPVLTIEGWGGGTGPNGDDQAYGLWIPSFPTRSFVSSSWSGSVALVSLEALLTYTSAASVLNTGNNITVLIPSGTVITDWIGNALTAAGIGNFAITASTKTENAPQTYTNGETLLQVINAELDRIGYSSLYSDMAGTLRADPYVLPADRPESFSDLRPFDVNGNSIFSTAFEFTDNAPNVPNRVRAVGKPVGWLAGQTAVAKNDDPNSPYSPINRDGRIVEKVYTEVNALSHAEVQSYANQQLVNLSKDGRKAVVKFLHLPGLAINNVVYLNATRAGAPMFATVDSLDVDLNVTNAPMGMSSATLSSVNVVEEEAA